MATRVTSLVIGDQHFRTNNLRECREFIDKILKALDKFKPNYVVCLGDLLHDHNRYEEAPFNLAIEFLRRLSDRCLTFLIVGNHDYRDNQQYLTDKHPYNALKQWGNDKIIVVDEPKVLTLHEFQFMFVPYVPKGRFIEALNNYDAWDMVDCIYAHQEFRGANMGAMVSHDGDEWDEGYPMVISGHIHGAQILPSGVYYPGSAMQHAYGESNDKRVWLCTFDSEAEETFSYRKINLKMPTKRIVYTTPNDLSNVSVSEGESVKISLKCSEEEFKALVKSSEYKSLVASSNVKVVRTNTREASKEIETFKKHRLGHKGETYSSILKRLIDEKNNKHLVSSYERLSVS